MRAWRSTTCFAASLFACFAAGYAQEVVAVGGAPVTLRLYSVDDVLRAYVTNSVYQHQVVLSEVNLGDTGFEDITQFLQPGEVNLIEVELNNIIRGWTYGYDLKVGGVTVWQGQCGHTGVFGCKGDDQTIGIVFQDQFKIGSPAQDVDFVWP